MADLVKVRLRIWGLVQGVGYRYFVRNRAMALGLRGYVKNRADGSVEVVAEGAMGTVTSFIEDVRVGPRYASVERVDLAWEEPLEGLEGFDYAS
jgi:acylphosphatase